MQGPYITYTPVAISVPFDNTGTGMTSTDVQAAILEARAIRQVEVDFGTIPTLTRTFLIIDSIVLTTSHLMIVQSGEAATGRDADENEMDPIIFSGLPQAGKFILNANSLNGPVVGKFKVNYKIG